MTVSYNEKFLKLLCRWRGSLWKCIWKELIVYLALYYTLNLVYRFGLNDEQKDKFELITLFCNRAQKFIPITFLLGFFVSQVLHKLPIVYQGKIHEPPPPKQKGLNTVMPGV